METSIGNEVKMHFEKGGDMLRNIIYWCFKHYLRLTSSSRLMMATAIVNRLPPVPQVGLLLDLGDLESNALKFSGFADQIADNMMYVGIDPQFLHPIAAKSLINDGTWREGIMLGQEIHLLVIGRCVASRSRNHRCNRLDLHIYFANGYELGWLDDERLNTDDLRENPDNPEWRKDLAEKTVLRIAQILRYLQKIKKLPDPGYTYYPNQWPEVWGQPQIGAQAGLRYDTCTYNPHIRTTANQKRR